METVERFLVTLQGKKVVTNMEDRVQWEEAKDGLFSVKSFYSTLEGSRVVPFPYSIIWSSCAPPKVGFFAWEASWGKVLTLDQLKKRRWSLPNRCLLCCAADETIDHLLIHCTKSKVLWDLLFTLFSVQWVLPLSVKEVLLGWHDSFVGKKRRKLGIGGVIQDHHGRVLRASSKLVEEGVVIKVEILAFLEQVLRRYDEYLHQILDVASNLGIDPMTKEFAGVPLSLISLDWQAACLYQQELFGLYLIVLSMHKLLTNTFAIVPGSDEAFCNPADVEEFTEEKKESLLTKRQGKGADFVRAVQEIVDSYEELKKQDQVDDFNSANDVAVTNSENLVDSSSNSGLKDQTEAPTVAVNSRLKTSYSAEDRSEPNLPIENAAAVTQIDGLHDGEALSQEPNDNMVVSETPTLATYSSRRRLGGMRLQTCTTQRRTSSARISRSLSRVDSCRFQNLIMPSNDGGKNSEDVATNGTRNGSLRRNKRIRKSPEASEWLDVDSPNFVLNGSVEDNGSEIVTAESDTLSFNEGSTIESGCRPEHSESVEGLEGDIELSKRFDLQTKAVVTKKKRKPNRKRVTNDTPDSVRQDNGAGLEVSVQRSGLNSENVCEISNERFSKEDGDEHLPLVKRARVRMGKPSSTVEALDNLVRIEEKSPMEVPLNLLEQVCTPSNCDDYDVISRTSPVVKGCLDNSLLSNDDDIQLAEDDTHLLTVKKNQPLGRSVDGEAALPPSKRLHRALEAMSANAAEDGQTCCVSSTKGYPQMSMENIAGNGLRVENVDSHGNGLDVEIVDFHSTDASEEAKVVLPMNLSTMISEETTKSSLEIGICNQPGENSDSLKDEFCKDMFIEAVGLADGKDVSGSSICAHTTKTLVVGQSPKHPDRKHPSSVSNQGSLDQLLHPKDETRSGNCDLINRRAEKPDGGLDNLGHIGMVSGPGSKTDEIPKVSPQNCTNMPLCDVKDNCHENTEPVKHPQDENIQINSMCKAVKEGEHDPTQKEMNAPPSPTSVKDVMVDVQGTQHLSHSASVSDEHLDDKDVSGDRLSLSPTDGVYSTARASLPNTLTCPMSTSDNSTSLQNNGCCSPGVHLHQEKTICSFDANEESKFEATVTHRPKSMGKWSNSAEASAALTSFEAMLGTLTRTKESIGRATRVAIDCAKFGIAAKVVEILARNLENEASLHKRVDLFFLVDSITQCSRGLKGDVGGIYPSAIQSALPRLLSAAAPPGSAAQENRRQCLKASEEVLRLWLERRILPESIVRHHMRDLDSLSGSSCTSSFLDACQEQKGLSMILLEKWRACLLMNMEAIQVFSFRVSVCPACSRMKMREVILMEGVLKLLLPEHVDGELEMEDVAPSCEVEMSSARDVSGINNAHNSHQFEPQFPLSYAPPLPNDVPPSSPPLPTSPPPPPPPLHLPHCPFLHLQYLIPSLTMNIQDNLQQSVVQQSAAPRINSSISEAVHYHAPESRDIQMQMQMPDSANSSGFHNFPGSHHPMRPANNVHQMDSANLHNRNYHLRPPHSAPSNQFSYVQADQRVQSRREPPPPPYPNRFHGGQNMEPGNFYNDHDGMKLAPHEFGENWRFSGPAFHGPLYPDKAKMPYSHSRPPYNGPPCEPTGIPNQWWPCPPRPTNHRNSMPIRPPPSEGAIPVASRVSANAEQETVNEDSVSFNQATGCRVFTIFFCSSFSS
ncbi:Protein HUA2-like 3 [Vitis vinifera]|uniref:Protein HUA2-like 3 n=1 Tax=Vitis vinifera TaxID=29760 RepID=A0A438KI07_VITVI|nr:Protein HUA2-like 3 [Vitis vinifera]